MREMASYDIIYAFLISNLMIEFLKKEDPMNELGLGILLHHGGTLLEWSVKIMILDPSRLGQNFSKVSTTIKNSFSVVV